MVNGLVLEEPGEKVRTDHTSTSFFWEAYHWLIQLQNGRMECDDYKGEVSSVDFWKIYFRKRFDKVTVDRCLFEFSTKFYFKL